MHDVAIVGGGILGVATGRELLTRHPRLKIVLLEKERALAAHQSGNNSGVIHSGIYYHPGSLRARLCSQGREALWNYCEKREIQYKNVGKLVVATRQSELPLLEELYRRGLANGLTDLRILESSEIPEREPLCHGIRAVLSPSTGIVDYAVVTRRLAEDFLGLGGEIKTAHEVTAIRVRGEEIELTCRNSATMVARHVVTCAGLFSDRVAAMTDKSADIRIVPFRGDYLLLRSGKAAIVRGCIYPVPDPRFPFLGVHATPRLDGNVWVGPNAVLALSREGYRPTSFNSRDVLELLTFTGFQRFAVRHLRSGLIELYRDISKRAYVSELRRYLPELQMSDVARGPSGVRAQAMARDGTLVDDFLFAGDHRVLHVRNAPSPAATASLAIARYIAREVEERFGASDHDSPPVAPLE